jgi:hypothetical protein
LRRRVEVLEAGQRRRSVVDRVADVRLLGAIAATLGSTVFGAADLVALPDAEIRAVLNGLDARRTRAWLRRLSRQTTAPFAVRRVGRDGAGAPWTLCVSDDVHTHRGLVGRDGGPC